MWGQSSFTKWRLNLNLKILGKILVSHVGWSIIFNQVQAKSELYNFRWDTVWSCGGQSSFTKCRLNLNFKILDEILVSHTGGQSSFTMCRLNLNFIILGEILLHHVGSFIFHHVQAKSELYNFRWDTVWSCGGQSSFTKWRLNLNLKILGKILVSHVGWSIIFNQVQAKSELYNFRWDTVWSCGGQSSFTKCRLNLNIINFRWDTVWSFGGQSSFTKCRLNLNFINFRWDAVWSCGG